MHLRRSRQGCLPLAGKLNGMKACMHPCRALARALSVLKDGASAIIWSDRTCAQRGAAAAE